MREFYEDDGVEPTCLTLIVRGIPRPQPRPRFNGRRVVSTTGKAALWRSEVRRAAKAAVEASGGRETVAAMLGPEVSVHLIFILPPKSFKSDADNLAKLALDALMAEGALGGDDRRVTTLVVQKLKADPLKPAMSALISKAQAQREVPTPVNPDPTTKPEWLSTKPNT